MSPQLTPDVGSEKTAAQSATGVAPNRLESAQYDRNLAPTQPVLTAEAAIAAADRCLFCEDAPCVAACPTAIDVPGFIGQILDDDIAGAARTVLDQNILGGICARVCPTDTLCEGACVYTARDLPAVEIAGLQGFAVDHDRATGRHPYTRAPLTGRRVAVVGAGPAGLSCAHRLAMLGHDVVVMDARPKPGGLNEYGIAAYKLPKDYAQAEIDWLFQIGGIELRCGVHLGRDTTLDALCDDFDAVFLGLGLAGANALHMDSKTGADLAHVLDAVDFIAAIRQAEDPAEVPVGQHVVVLGGGCTAMDAAVQARLLGATHVTIAYREAEAQMGAQDSERLHAASKGVRIVTAATPLHLLGEGAVEAVEFAHTPDDPTARPATGDTFRIKADQVLKAIGQRLADAPGGLALTGGRIATDAHGRTSRLGVWAAGDCASGDKDLTVIAVAQGRAAAEDIHRALVP